METSHTAGLARGMNSAEIVRHRVSTRFGSVFLIASGSELKATWMSAISWADLPQLTVLPFLDQPTLNQPQRDLSCDRRPLFLATGDNICYGSTAFSLWDEVSVRGSSDKMGA